MSLPTGKWAFNGGGSAGDFTVTLSDDQGNLKATLDGQNVQGFYDEAARKLVFMAQDSNDSTIQVFTGQLFSSTVVDFSRYMLVGTVETFSGSGSQVSVSVDGWYASIGRVIT